MTEPADKPRRTGDAPRNKAMARSSARIAAVQGLYQMDIAGTGLDTVIDERLDYRFVVDGPGAGGNDGGSGETPPPATDGNGLPEPDATFMAEILRGVMRRQRDIDPAVDQQLAEGWRLGRVDSTLRAILRAGVFELMERPDVPVRVVISEYVQIAHAFFDGDEPKVVNGVLDKLARKFRAGEFENSPT